MKLALKKLHNLSHNSPVLSHNLPGNIAQFLIFYRTLSDGLLIVSLGFLAIFSYFLVLNYL